MEKPPLTYFFISIHTKGGETTKFRVALSDCIACSVEITQYALYLSPRHFFRSINHVFYVTNPRRIVFFLLSFLFSFLFFSFLPFFFSFLLFFFSFFVLLSSFFHFSSLFVVNCRFSLILFVLVVLFLFIFLTRLLFFYISFLCCF